MFGQAETLVDGIFLTVGSSSAITACGAARLGLRVGFVGVVGDDESGRFMLRSLAERGIDVDACLVDPARPTGASVILGRGDDRAILTAIGAIDALRASDVPISKLGRARHVHVGALYVQTALRPDLAGLLAAAHAAGCTISIDPNWDPAERWAPLDDLLAVADICFVNLTEAQALTGEDDAEAAARALGRRGPTGSTVVVKLGAEGVLAVRGEEIHQASAPPVAVVDTTGAGDSFDAGFIAAFSAGWTLAQCLDLAVICGSASTQRPGGVDGQPRFDEAVSLANEWGRAIPGGLR